MEQPIEPAKSGAAACWRFAHVQFDELHGRVLANGRAEALDRSCQLLLAHFLRHPGELVRKETLLEVGWRGRIVSENSVAKAIGRLRQAIGDDQGNLLRVVHGYGYRLQAHVEPGGLAGSRTAPATAGRAAGPWQRSLALALVLALTLVASVRIPFQEANANTTRPAVPAVGSIAILPFEDLSTARDQAYFADGLADELLNNLVQLPSLRVASRTSSFAYRGRPFDIPAIGRALGVDTVLEGSVRSSEHRLRITVTLVDAANGFPIWSKAYERPVTELFALQDDITREIVGALRIELLPEQLQGLARHHTRSPEAYRLYLFGRNIWQDDETAERRSINAYRRAVAIDPQFLDAWLALADALGHMGLYADSAEEALAGKREAREVMDRLIAGHPDRADFYLQRAEPRYAQWWDWKGAEADFAQAARHGQPEDVAATIMLSRFRAATGRMDEAMALTKQAMVLDPTVQAATVRGYHLFATRRCDEARDVLRQRILADPRDEHAHYYLGLCDLQQGKPRSSLAHFEDSSHVLRLTGEALAWHALGDAVQSERSLQLLISRYGAITPYQVAEVYASRGERDQAFAWLQRSARYRDASFMYLAFDPLLDNIRGDARFAALTKTIGLHDYAPQRF